jgi:hypothetical protein
MCKAMLEREFDVINSDSSVNKIRLQISEPYLISDGIDKTDDDIWVCEYILTGNCPNIKQEVRGRDSIQAIRYTFSSAYSILKVIGQTYGQTITWEGDDELGLGHLEMKLERDPRINEFFQSRFDEFVKNAKRMK